MLTGQLVGRGGGNHVKTGVCFRLILKFKVVYHTHSLLEQPFLILGILSLHILVNLKEVTSVISLKLA